MHKAIDSNVKKIAIILPDLRGGGAERVSIDLARAFVALGHKVEIVLMTAKGDFLDEARQHFSVVDLDVARARDSFWPIAGYLSAHSPDAVLAMMWPLTAIAPFATKVSGYDGRVLVCEHGILSRQYGGYGAAHMLLLRASTAIAYRLASARVGVSAGTAADMARLAWLDPSKVTPIHNAVRILPRPSAEAKEAANALWNTTGPRILAVGSFKPVKNHSLLLRAFALLGRRDARLLLLGEGPGEQMLRALASELAIADRVIFAGFHADPSPFYNSADLFVLSSNHEGLPTVLIEALSFGLPVVSTNCPSGPAEILENGRHGRLVPVGDDEALANAMAEALDAEHDRDALRRRAADFSPERAAEQYLRLLFP